MSNGSPNETIWMKIAAYAMGGIVAMATAIGIFMGGYEVGTGKGDEVKELLQQQKTELENQNQKLRAELEVTRRFIPPQQSKVTPQEPISPLRREGPRSTQVGSPTGETPRPTPEEAVEVSLSTGTSLPLFKGELVLSLVGLSFETSPSRYKAYFTLNSGGSKPEEFRNVDPGFSTTYQRFRILLMETGTSGAKFRITRLPDTG